MCFFCVLTQLYLYYEIFLNLFFPVICGTFQKEFNIPHRGEEGNISISLNCEDVYGHSIFINEVKFERNQSRRNDLKRSYGERCNNRITCAIDIGSPNWLMSVNYKCKYVSSF